MFWTTFEKERDKYIRENMEKLKRDKKLANKLICDDHQTHLQKNAALA